MGGAGRGRWCVYRLVVIKHVKYRRTRIDMWRLLGLLHIHLLHTMTMEPAYLR